MILAALKWEFIDGVYRGRKIPYYVSEEYVEIERSYYYEVLMSNVDYADIAFSSLAEGRGIRELF